MPVDALQQLLNAETLKVLGFLLALFALAIFAIVRTVFPFMRGLAQMGVSSFEKAWDKMVSVQGDVAKALQEIREALNHNTQALRENTERLARIENDLNTRVERVEHVERTIERKLAEYEARNRRRRFLWW
jgi:cell shape-determining protein MreC